jgi:FtsP/CotA-like multicopper oxidase with cupredoxin domain
MTRTSFTRRQAVALGATLGGAVALAARPATASAAPSASRRWAPSYSGGPEPVGLAPGVAGRDYRPTLTPGGATLPFKVVDGVKVFHLVAEEVDHEFAPGLRARCWGYNGRVHGPTIEAVEGDRVRVYVTNKLRAPTTVHWHGIFLPSGMDGVGGLNQRAIAPGETFRYEWTFKQSGTFMYHSHHDEMTQMAMGLMGMIVVHPRNPSADDRVDRDFVIMLSEWKIVPGAKRPDPNEMTDFNVLTMNAKAFPGTAPLVVRKGDRVRIRFGNLGAMDHHPIHLHGYYFKVTATDGGAIPRGAQWPETTVLVSVGSTRDIEFIADEPGDWAMHCHMTHHVMNQMGHDLPNMLGVETRDLEKRARHVMPGYMAMGQHGMGAMAEMDMAVPDNSIPMLGARGPFDAITMGGMFTIVKVRDEDVGRKNEDPGWYANPPGTVADVASKEELRRDDITA